MAGEAFADGGPVVFAKTPDSVATPFDSHKRSIGRDAGPGLGVPAPAGAIQLGFDPGQKQVSAVQFLISANHDLSDADLSACAGGLPETHVGGCKVKGENILFYAFSPVNAALPGGTLGKIALPAGTASVQVEVSEPAMADINGVEIMLD
ncbi:MAG: hypothetical protein ACNS61_08740 [Candidatus Wenzhouxiangella sp. M2_3B_020]